MVLKQEKLAYEEARKASRYSHAGGQQGGVAVEKKVCWPFRDGEGGFGLGRGGSGLLMGPLHLTSKVLEDLDTVTKALMTRTRHPLAVARGGLVALDVPWRYICKLVGRHLWNRLSSLGLWGT